MGERKLLSHISTMKLSGAAQTPKWRVSFVFEIQHPPVCFQIANHSSSNQISEAMLILMTFVWLLHLHWVFSSWNYAVNFSHLGEFSKAFTKSWQLQDQINREGTAKERLFVASLADTKCWGDYCNWWNVYWVEKLYRGPKMTPKDSMWLLVILTGWLDVPHG